MRRYEMVFIVNPDLDKVEEIIDRYSKVVLNAGGRVEKVDRWGLRRLAYKIKNKTKGEYIRLEYVSPSSVPKEIESLMRRDDSIMRFLTVKLEDKVKVEKASNAGQGI